jgi:hypothetical protein
MRHAWRHDGALGDGLWLAKCGMVMFRLGVVDLRVPLCAECSRLRDAVDR